MSDNDFSSPDAAEDMFYKAFEDADLDAMMEAWDSTEDIICIHPMSHQLTGLNAIQRSWSDIFQYSPKVKISVDSKSYLRSGGISIHVLHEVFHVEGETTPQAPVLATNIYRLTDSGWRMILHHSSSLPKQRDQKKKPVLH